MVTETSRLAITMFAIVLAACQTTNPPPRIASSPQQDDALTLSQAACGGCHAVEYPELSPNPAAPTFASIANRKGLTRETLTSWLADAHNYPEVMDFDLDPDQIDLIAGHIRTLQREDYKPES